MTSSEPGGKSWKIAIMVWRARSPTPLRSRSTSSRQSARASAYWPEAARASASWNLRFRSSGLVGQGGAGGLDAAGVLGLEPEDQFGLEPLGFRLEEALAFHGDDRGLGLVEPALLQGDPCQPDLGRDQVGVERQHHVVLRLGGLRVGRFQPAASATIRSAGVGSNRSSQARIADSDWTPMKPSTAWPSRTPNTAGIDRTPNCIASSDSLVGVDLGQHELTAVLLGEPLQQRTEHLAGSAPLGPEVDHHRHFR